MAAALLREEWPRATFTTLQISHGFGAQPNVGAYNVGLSYTCSVGDFRGDGLWKAVLLGSTKVCMPNLGASLSHLAGCVLRGWVTDTRCAWTTIQEQQIHAVDHYTGDRASLVAYTRSALSELSQEVASDLRLEGFLLPPDAGGVRGAEQCVPEADLALERERELTQEYADPCCLLVREGGADQQPGLLLHAEWRAGHLHVDLPFVLTLEGQQIAAVYV